MRLFRRWPILCQLVKEFWLPTVIGLLWAFYRGGDLATSIANFGSALFLSWWFLGQIFRVSRQQAQDKKLDAVQASLTTLVEPASRICTGR
jgi:hypothetical protein